MTPELVVALDRATLGRVHVTSAYERGPEDMVRIIARSPPGVFLHNDGSIGLRAGAGAASAPGVLLHNDGSIGAVDKLRAIARLPPAARLVPPITLR